jgi:hypothetical protein
LVRLGSPCAVAADEIARRIGGPCAFIGDAVEAYGEVFRQVLGDGAVLYSTADHPPSAVPVARLATARLESGDAGDDLVTLEPSYLRPPEAELTQSAHSPSSSSDPLRFVDKVPIVY